MLWRLHQQQRKYKQMETMTNEYVNNRLFLKDCTKEQVFVYITMKDIFKT